MVDETKVYAYDTETKQQSNHWHTKEGAVEDNKSTSDKVEIEDACHHVF